VHRDFPILRDPDGYTYVKEEVGGLVVGGFEPDAKPWVSPDALPYPFEFKLLKEDWDHFAILMDSAVTGSRCWPRPGSRCSTTARRASPRTTSSSWARPRSCGTSSSAPASTRSAIASAGGAGGRWPSGSPRASPAWTCPRSTIRRFAALQRQQPVAARPGGRGPRPALRRAMANRELTSARPFRRSPAYHLLKQAKRASAARWAGSGPTTSRPAGDNPEIGYGWGRQNWQPWSSAEQRAARTTVALFDQTSFSKYLLTGPDAERALQWLWHRRRRRPPGPDRLHRDAERARHLRGRRHRHPALGRGVPAGQQLREYRTRPGPHHRRTPQGCHASLVDVTLAVRRLRGHGTPVARPAGQALPR